MTRTKLFALVIVVAVFVVPAAAVGLVYGLLIEPRPAGVAARSLPRSICGLVAEDTIRRLVPAARSFHTPSRRVDGSYAVCSWSTDDGLNHGYATGSLVVSVSRYDTTAEQDAAERARAAVRRGPPVPGLGDRSRLSVRPDELAGHSAKLDVAYGDTVVRVEYEAEPAGATATGDAAVRVAREVLAGLR